VGLVVLVRRYGGRRLTEAYTEEIESYITCMVQYNINIYEDDVTTGVHAQSQWDIRLLCKVRVVVYLVGSTMDTTNHLLDGVFYLM